MTNRERIFLSIQFIESNLQSEINVSDIAQEACCSLYHFIRLFKSITEISPKKYLLQRRLTESISELRNTNKKISVIAFDFQFSSNEVFTRAFKKQFNTSPSNVKKGKIIPDHITTKQLTEEYIFQSKKARNQSPEIIELPKKIIVGSSYFIPGSLKQLDLSTHWNTFLNMIDKIENKITPVYSYQIQFWSENQMLEGMHFFIGAEVNSIEDISPEFVVKVLPKGKYLKFIHSGLSKNVGYTYRYIYNEFLPDTDYRLSEPFNFEYYGNKYISADKEKSESLIFIPIK